MSFRWVLYCKNSGEPFPLGERLRPENRQTEYDLVDAYPPGGPGSEGLLLVLELDTNREMHSPPDFFDLIFKREEVTDAPV